MNVTGRILPIRCPVTRGHSKSGHVGPVLVLIIFVFLLRRRDVADRLEQASMVEPLDPFKRHQLHGFEMAPGAVPADELGYRMEKLTLA